MIKIGDKVKVKSLDEVLEIEGVSSMSEVGHPGINHEMKPMFGDVVIIADEYDSGIFDVKTSDDWCWTIKPEWIDLENVEPINRMEIIVDENGKVSVFKNGKELKGVTEVAFTAKVDEVPELYVKGFVL